MEYKMKGTEFLATAGWDAKYGGIEAMLYEKLVRELFAKHKCDMYIFEYESKNKFESGDLIVSMEGYNVETEEYIPRKVVKRLKESAPIDKFWCKIDDYGDHFIATFLFPDEY